MNKGGWRRDCPPQGAQVHSRFSSGRNGGEIDHMARRKTQKATAGNCGTGRANVSGLCNQSQVAVTEDARACCRKGCVGHGRLKGCGINSEPRRVAIVVSIIGCCVGMIPDGDVLFDVAAWLTQDQITFCVDEDEGQMGVNLSLFII